MKSARVAWSRLETPLRQCFDGCHGPEEWVGECEPGDAEGGGEGLAGAAGVDDVVGVESLEGADGLAVVAELAVVVVFDDPGVVAAGPVEELGSSVRCHGVSERVLVCGSNDDGSHVEAIQFGDVDAVFVDGHRNGCHPGQGEDLAGEEQ